MRIKKDRKKILIKVAIFRGKVQCLESVTG